MSWYPSPVIQYASPLNGTKGWMTELDAAIAHDTYGQFAGDQSVGLYGVGFQFHIPDDGRIFQYYDSRAVAWHCNGANFRALGCEFGGEGDLTAAQIISGGILARLVRDIDGVPLVYCAPGDVGQASVWVNGGGYRGWIPHLNVATDDGSAQHTDSISRDQWNQMTASAPAPAPTQEDDMDNRGRLLIVTGDPAIWFVIAGRRLHVPNMGVLSTLVNGDWVLPTGPKKIVQVETVAPDMLALFPVAA